MKDEENDFYTEFNDNYQEEESWQDKLEEDISRIENFVQKELEKGTRTEKNIQAYLRERRRRKSRNSHDWMEELDHVTLGFLLIEIAFMTYFILALIGVFPMF